MIKKMIEKLTERDMVSRVLAELDRGVQRLNDLRHCERDLHPDMLSRDRRRSMIYHERHLVPQKVVHVLR